MLSLFLVSIPVRQCLSVSRVAPVCMGSAAGLAPPCQANLCPVVPQHLVPCRLSDDEVEDLPEEELMYRTSAGALCPADSAQGVVERFCTSLPGHSS
jgi:hypothetical protein